MAGSKTIRKFRNQIGIALQNLSQRRINAVVPELKRQAVQKVQEASIGNRRVAMIYNEPPTSWRTEHNYGVIEAQQRANLEAGKKSNKLLKKAERIEQRHTTGWIGKTIRRIKGN